MTKRYEIREEVPGYVLLEKVAAFEVAEKLKISNFLHKLGPELLFLQNAINLYCSREERKAFNSLILRPATRNLLLIEIMKDAEFRHKLYMLAGGKKNEG